MVARESRGALGGAAAGLDSAGLPSDPLARIEVFRTFEDGWEDGHRGISDEVADRAAELVRALNVLDVFVAPSDGSIVLRRRWREHRYAHGRSVEVLPGGLMLLCPDFAGEDQPETVDCQLAGVAAAWLAHPTRAASAAPGDAARTSPSQVHSSPFPGGRGGHVTPSAIAEYAERIGAHHSLYENGWADVHTFVESLGGGLDIGGSGESLVVDGDRFTVYLPLSTSWLRDRLLISRALGHLFLHYLVPQAVSGTAVQRTFFHGLTGQRWSETGVFASALLMPRERFVDAYWQSGEDLALVAKTFRVPWESARSRGFALGLPVGVHSVGVAS